MMVLLASTGCMASRYLVQAGRGQLDITYYAQSLDAAIKDPRTPARTRVLLGRVGGMKAFAVRQGLTPTGSYRKYRDLVRPAVVWVVSACEPLRFSSKSWNFPIVGNVPYLGWFHRDDADAFAAELRAKGWDVDVRGASAYSTLGWFDDPVLSTMIPDSDEALGELADTVIHESVHATIYIGGQTPFNESIASFIADHLVLQYLDEEAGNGSHEKRAYLEEEREGDRRTAILHRAYERLKALYASSAPAPEKLLQKRLILRDLGNELHARRALNNAALVGLETYSSGSPELEALLKTCDGSFPRLIDALRKVRPASFKSPHETHFESALAPLIQAGCR